MFQKKVVGDDVSLGHLGSGDFYFIIFFFKFHLNVLKSGIF